MKNIYSKLIFFEGQRGPPGDEIKQKSKGISCLMKNMHPQYCRCKNESYIFHVKTYYKYECFTAKEPCSLKGILFNTTIFIANCAYLIQQYSLQTVHYFSKQYLVSFF